MIGVVVITHGDLAKELVHAAEGIIGNLERVCWVAVRESYKGEEVRLAIKKAIKQVDTGYGVLLLTDMFGGTPSNLSLTFLEKGRVEVLTGVNLPILLKLATYRKDRSLKDVTRYLKDYGKESIIIAGDVLEGKEQ